MVAITFNPYVLITQRNINQSNMYIGQALQRMSTGYKINSASDNPSDYVIASTMNSKLKSLSVAQSNIATATSYLQTTESALSTMTEISTRLRDLAVQGSNNTMTYEARRTLQNEANSLLDELFRIKSETKFNDLNVFGIDALVSQAASLLSFTPPL